MLLSRSSRSSRPNGWVSTPRAPAFSAPAKASAVLLVVTTSTARAGLRRVRSRTICITGPGPSWSCTKAIEGRWASTEDTSSWVDSATKPTSTSASLWSSRDRSSWTITWSAMAMTARFISPFSGIALPPSWRASKVRFSLLRSCATPGGSPTSRTSSAKELA